MTRKWVHRSLRAAVAGSVSLAAMAAHAGPGPAPPAAPATVTTLQPYSGNISAFSGNISAFSGNISAFSGNISAFYGNIGAFSGNISAFSGNISAFSGNISAFSGNISAFTAGSLTGTGSGVIDPFWGNISAFSSTLGKGVNPLLVNYGGIGDFWSAASPKLSGLSAAWAPVTDKTDKATLQALSAQFTDLQNTSAAFWGAAATAQTGKASFYDAFAKGLYSKYGFDPSNTSSLSQVSALNRNLFIIDWFDSLMNFTGTDHVDWWMQSANWNPGLTQTQGGGHDAVIGLLDFQISSGAVAQGSLVNLKGVSNFSNGHGAAVASLIVAPHDGKGVMGIAPNATLIAYNPFDSSGTANWTDVTNGVAALLNSGADVVNLSLGVPGWTLNPSWNQVFTAKTVAPQVPGTVFVLAAGNDGVAQTTSAGLSAQAAANLIVVGSIGPTDVISPFSNQPGTACLTADKKCPDGSRLMDHFITAPGELILVDDGAGGVTRRIGTSFAAPLVTGAVALLQDRWPWLTKYPTETASIILKSARDLGAPGTDPVYGVGALDVTASQSPLSFDALHFLTVDSKGALKEQPNAAVRTTTDAQLATFDTQGLYYYAYETVGGTFRDFAIPLSNKLVGQSILSAGGTQQMFQQYVYARMTDWMTGGTGVIHEAKGKKFADSYSFASEQTFIPIRNPWGLRLSMDARPWAATPLGYRASQSPVQTDVKLASEDGRQAFSFGYGGGARALIGMSGFGMDTDSNASMGGANPVLGLASGGGYAQWSTKLSDKLGFAAGYTQRVSRLDLDQLASPDRRAMKDLGDYKAGAGHMSLSYAATPQLSLTAGMTHLDEGTALLGTRSLDPADFAGGSRTDAGTLGAEWRPSGTLRVSASATLGRTQQGGADSTTFRTAGGGLRSTAYEVAVDKLGLFDGADRLRMTLSQPLAVEAGQLAYTSVQVIDRQSGELGAVTQLLDAKSPDKRYVAELLYGHALKGAVGEWGVFGRLESRSEYAGRTGPEAMAGARFRISY